MTNYIAGRIEAQIAVPASTTISATNGGGTATVTAAAAGSYYWTTAGGTTGLLATLQANLNATSPLSAGWTVTLSTGATGTGLVTIDCSSRPFSIAWTSTTLRDLLGFTADITAVSSAQTGTKQARGLWMPNCPLMADQHPSIAPPATDQRTTTGPTGVVYGLFGNIRYRNTSLRWSHVPNDRVWEYLATTANSSWEYFHNETQLGRGASWFKVASRVQIYDHNGVLVGIGANSGAGHSGWWITGINDVKPTRPVQGWDGLYEIMLPEIVMDGS